MHPRCRCTIIAYMEGTGRGQRAAGRTRISADVSYRQWLKSLTAENAGDKIGAVSKPLTAAQIRAIKTAEDEAFHAKTGANFGFRMMSGSPNWSREILLANPPDEQYGYTPNCQRCVVAHEARMHGYDIVARPSWSAGDSTRSTGEWLHAFDYAPPDIVTCVGKSAGEIKEFIENKMRSFEKGSRAIVVFKWSKVAFRPAEGHAIVAQCHDNGVVNFGDPQTGKRAVGHLLNSIDTKAGVLLLRVDNLKFTDLIKRCCMNRSG